MDIKTILRIKPLVFRYLTEYYSGMVFIIPKQHWYKDNEFVRVPHNINHDSLLTFEIQGMFGLDKLNTNDIINQWFRRTYHTDLFNKNKTKILQKKLKRWGK